MSSGNCAKCLHCREESNRKNNRTISSLDELTYEICIYKEEMSRLSSINKANIETLRNLMTDQEIGKIEEVKATNETFNIQQDVNWKQAPLNKQFLSKSLFNYVSTYGNVIDPDRITEFVWEERKNRGDEREVFSIKRKTAPKQKPRNKPDKKVIDMSNTNISKSNISNVNANTKLNNLL